MIIRAIEVPKKVERFQTTDGQLFDKDELSGGDYGPDMIASAVLESWSVLPRSVKK